MTNTSIILACKFNKKWKSDIFNVRPTGNLDPEVSNGILDLFEQINRSGTSILMATHDFSLLERNSYKIFKCEQGKLVEVEDSKN